MATIHINRGGTSLGTFSEEDVRAGLRSSRFIGTDLGWREGMLSVLRIPIANVIAIMAGRRALVAYFRSLQDGKVVWDKTVHDRHPATASPVQAAAALQAVQP